MLNKVGQQSSEFMQGVYASGLFSSQSNFLKGEILTIIEASVLDDRQCKAVKDLIHAAFTNRVRYVETICRGGMQQVGCESTPGNPIQTGGAADSTQVSETTN